jgi:hypothetical protein
MDREHRAREPHCFFRVCPGRSTRSSPTRRFPKNKELGCLPCSGNFPQTALGLVRVVCAPSMSKSWTDNNAVAVAVAVQGIGMPALLRPLPWPCDQRLRASVRRACPRVGQTRMLLPFAVAVVAVACQCLDVIQMGVSTEHDTTQRGAHYSGLLATPSARVRHWRSPPL